MGAERNNYGVGGQGKRWTSTSFFPFSTKFKAFLTQISHYFSVLRFHFVIFYLLPSVFTEIAKIQPTFGNKLFFGVSL